MQSRPFGSGVKNHESAARRGEETFLSRNFFSKIARHSAQMSVVFPRTSKQSALLCLSPRQGFKSDGQGSFGVSSSRRFFRKSMGLLHRKICSFASAPEVDHG